MFTFRWRHHENIHLTQTWWNSTVFKMWCTILNHGVLQLSTIITENSCHISARCRFKCPFVTVDSRKNHTAVKTGRFAAIWVVNTSSKLKAWQLYNGALRWRHTERDGISNHQPHDCVLNRLFRHRRKKTSKLRVTGLCEGNSSLTDEFPAQNASNTENVSRWWRNHGVWLE